MSMSCKRILYFMDSGLAFGGAVNTLLLQAILMKKHGHEVFVCFSCIPGGPLIPAYRRMCTENHIPLFFLPYDITSYTEGVNVVSLLENYDTMKNTIAYLKPDIVHSVQINPTVELITRKLKIPHIMAIYQASSDFFSLRYLDVWPKFMICDSNYWAKVWQKGLELETTCIRTIAQNPLLRNSVTKQETRYICVGSVCPRKNQFEVIKAFHLLLSQGIKARLDIYGYDCNSYAEKCREYVMENSLESRVVFHGYCDDMQAVYRDSDAVIIGSTVESYPNVVSEAMANSVSVISTPVAGVPEVIKDSYNGYLSAGYSGEDIAAKLMQFENDKQNGRADQILQNANRTFLTEHSEDAVYEKLLAYHESVQEKFSTALVSVPPVTISDVKSAFSDILNLYERNFKNFTNTVMTARMLWYFLHAAPVIQNLSPDSRFYIWGAGKYGVYALENLKVFFPFIRLKAFIDSKKEGEFKGLTIEKPEVILSDEKSIVFIGAVGGQWDIIDTLEKHGKVCHRTYFFLVPRSW